MFSLKQNLYKRDSLLHIEEEGGYLYKVNVNVGPLD